jgi:hypothetical protein
MGLWNIAQLIGPKAVFDQLAVFFRISHDDRTRVDFDYLAFDAEILDRDAVAVLQVCAHSAVFSSAHGIVL